MSFHVILVRLYTQGIYYAGNRTFKSIDKAYHEDVKKYAAEIYRDDQIADALYYGYITQEEYDETMAYKHPVEKEAE